jgi:hypothetical protein
MDLSKTGVEEVDQSLGAARGLTLLQDAEKRRSEREHSLFLDVPTWDGDLVCEYRVVGPEDLRKIAERAVRQARNGSSSEPGQNDIALIIASHVGLYARDRESGTRVPIEDDFGHVGYGRIASVLGVESKVKSNSDAVKYLMSERDDNTGETILNVLAISLHANAISRWMRDPSKRTADLEEILGEF